MNCSKQKEQIKYSMIFTMIICVIAHGYRFLNLLNSHDSMLNIVQDDVYWQRSLGRFMQPVLMVLRGSICAPWLLCLISAVFLGLSVYLVCVIFRIYDKLTTLILAGVMVCNVVFTSSYAAYLPWVDVYAIALFLSLLGVWCINHDNWKVKLCGCLALSFSMGFYQAYIGVAIAGLMILAVCVLMEEESFKVIVKKVGGYLGCLVFSGVIYYVLYNAVCKLHNVKLADSYNGLASVGEFADVTIWSLILGAYKEFFEYFANQKSFASIILMNIKVMNAWRALLFISFIVTCIIIIAGIIRRFLIQKTKLWNVLLQIVVVLLFPLGVNLVYIISEGMEHELMVYSFLFVYVFAIVVIKKNMGLASKNRFEKWYVAILLLPLMVVIWNNVVFSNQLYYKVHLQQEATQSVMTKILYEIEHMDEYEYGVTPVVFIGNLNKSDYIRRPEYFNEIEVIGTGASPLSYAGVEASYAKYFLNNKVNVLNVALDNPEVEAMPTYPSRGSIIYLNEMIVVKLSN